MLLRLSREILLAFFTALGLVLGGSMVGSLSAFFTRASPFGMMRDLATNLRMWAIVAAIGGTFPTIRVIESGLFDRQVAALFQQLVVIISALLGAYLGYWLVLLTTGGE